MTQNSTLTTLAIAATLHIAPSYAQTNEPIPQQFLGDWGGYSCGFEERWKTTTSTAGRLQRAVVVKDRQIVWSPLVGMRCDLEGLISMTPDRIEGIFSCGDPELGGFRASPVTIKFEGSRRVLAVEVGGAYKDNSRYSFFGLGECRKR